MRALNTAQRSAAGALDIRRDYSTVEVLRGSVRLRLKSTGRSPRLQPEGRIVPDGADAVKGRRLSIRETTVRGAGHIVPGAP